MVTLQALLAAPSFSPPTWIVVLHSTLLHFGDCCWLILVSWAFFSGLNPSCRDGPGQLLSRTRHLVWSKDRLAPCLKSKKPLRPLTDNVLFTYLFTSCSFLYSQTQVDIFHFFFY